METHRPDLEKTVPGPLDYRAEDHRLRVWVEEDSRSLIRIAPDTVRRAMFQVPEEYRDLSDKQLRSLIGGFSALDNQLRLSFWLEYERCQSQMLPKMSTGNIIRGICSEEFFYKLLLRDPKRTAFMITPPVHYTAQLMEGLDYGISRLREDILELEIVNPVTKKIDYKAAELILKATMFLDMRLKGAFTQRIEQNSKTLSVSLHGAHKDVSTSLSALTDQALEKRLLQLEAEERKARGEIPISTQRAAEREAARDARYEESVAHKRGQMSDEEWAAIKAVSSDVGPVDG